MTQTTDRPRSGRLPHWKPGGKPPEGFCKLSPAIPQELKAELYAEKGLTGEDFSELATKAFRLLLDRRKRDRDRDRERKEGRKKTRSAS